MLLEIAIGDAYGAGMEYVPEDFTLEHNDLKSYCKHPSYHALNAGQYTDDTQMSLAVAETLLNTGNFSSLTKRDFINGFYQSFKRDPRDGYSRGFQQFLIEVESPEQFEATINSDSNKSGGAMRAGPVGLLPNLELVNQVAALQASVTHNTTLGMDAARAVALSVFYCKNALGRRKDLDQFLNKHVPGYLWSEDWTDRICSIGIYHVRAAVTLIRRTNSLSEILQTIVGFGGDVDTAAAIAMAIASQDEDTCDDLPEVLYSSLEDGDFGRTYLEGIDKMLRDRF